MKILRHLPNTLTSANLLCGCVGIVLTLHSEDTFPDNIAYAAYFVWAACIFDFFDGFVARLLHVSSPIGKELDSLADIVSFGVLPAVLMYRMIATISPSPYLPFIAFSIAIFSALRLAKFNIDENQTDSFIGVPTPANALFITSLVFLKSPFDTFISWDVFLIVITLIFSYLLVCPLELFALKFKNFGWVDNKLRFTFIGAAVLLVGFWQASAIPFIILLYIALSLLTRWIRI
ncbi:CDP-diacylglycerol--serine O-phosphatidyltransferase [soil metagenome]